DATTRWEETQSPPIPVADLLLPRQDITVAGQAEFAENLAFNIWRVPAEHAPLGSIGQARRIAYQASADHRRTVNGVTLDEPSPPDPTAQPSRELIWLCGHGPIPGSESRESPPAQLNS